MRIRLVILIIMLQPIIMKSQNATATLGNIASCAGENVLVPMVVTDFNDIGAMTIYISYDTNAAEFLSIQNINPAIPGSITSNSYNGQVSIAYSCPTPFYISGESLFDLSFTYLGDSTSLDFITGTEIADVNLEIIPLDTYPGSIITSIQIIDQPDSVQSYPDNDVLFRVISSGDINFQWQENTGADWGDLQNNSTYSGVTNDTLILHDVPLSFDGNNYRCVLTAGNCSEITNAALLEVAEAFPVATLGMVYSCPDNQILEPVYVGDFFDVIEFNFNITYDTAALSYVQLQNIYPGLASGILTVVPMVNLPGITIYWQNSNPISINNAKLFDIEFNYDSQNHPVSFTQGTYVRNASSNLIDITLNNGAIQQFAVPVITNQPDDEIVMEFDDAQFNISADGADEFRWMISTDDGNSWNFLEDTPPYYNVYSPAMTISPAIYSMNNNQYACRLTNINCSIVSESALLTVDTLTFISDMQGEDRLLIYPIPFKDYIHLTLKGRCLYNSGYIINAEGQVCYTLYNIKGKNEITINVSFLPQGIYMLILNGIKDGIEHNEKRTMLKATE
jgi:hypothetical protein